MYSDLKYVLFFIVCISIITIIDQYIIENILLHSQLKEFRKNLLRYKNIKKQKKLKGSEIIIPFYEYTHDELQNVIELYHYLDYLKCPLTKKIYYRSDKIPETYIQILNTLQLKNVDMMTKKIHTQSLNETNFRIWCIIASKSDNLIIIDPKVIVLSNPEKWLMSEKYRVSGTLFWKQERNTKYKTLTKQWMNTILPYKKGNYQLYNGDRTNLQTHSVICISKNKHRKSIEYLEKCAIEIDLIEKYHMESDIYWMCCDIAEENYILHGKYYYTINSDENKFLGNLFLSPNEQEFAFIDRELCYDKEYDLIINNYSKEKDQIDPILYNQINDYKNISTKIFSMLQNYT